MPDNQDSRAARVARFTRYGWGVLGYNLLVILWGAYVRATGSGAGCGAHWPLCNGTVIPRAPTVETLIELTHRTASGLALAAVVLLMFWARRLFAPGSTTRRAAHAATALMVTEALVSAGLAVFQMIADNDAVARASWLAAHLLTTFLLIAALALVPWFASGHRAPKIRGGGRSVTMLALSLGGLLLLGMTGAVTALGDSLLPAATLAEGLAQDPSPTAIWLTRLRVIHPILAVLVGGLVLLTAGVASRDHPSRTTQDFGLGLAVLVAAQMIAGLMNLMLMAPVWMQLFHLLLADGIWLTVVLLGAAALGTADGGRQTAD